MAVGPVSLEELLTFFMLGLVAEKVPGMYWCEFLFTLEFCCLGEFAAELRSLAGGLILAVVGAALVWYILGLFGLPDLTPQSGSCMTGLLLDKKLSTFSGGTAVPSVSTSFGLFRVSCFGTLLSCSSFGLNSLIRAGPVMET